MNSSEHLADQGESRPRESPNLVEAEARPNSKEPKLDIDMSHSRWNQANITQGPKDQLQLHNSTSQPVEEQLCNIHTSLDTLEDSPNQVIRRVTPEMETVNNDVCVREHNSAGTPNEPV